MPRKHKQASKPMYDNNLEKVSDSQNKHYSKMGYKPFISEGGKIKWQSFEQHAYEVIKYANRNRSNIISTIITGSNRTSRFIKSLYRTIRYNWLFFLLVIAAILMILFSTKLFSILN